MTTRQNSESAALATSGIAGVIAGAGIVTFALFPLAIPFLLLTAVFTAPLLLIGIVPALAFGIVAAIVLAVRAIARRLARPRGGRHPREPVHPRARGAGDTRELLAPR